MTSVLTSTLSDGRAAFTNHLKNSVRWRDIDGFKYSLRCHRYPVDISVINDDTIAVSNASGAIEIINTETLYMNEILTNVNHISGLTYTMDHLFFCQENKGVRMVNLHSQTITDIVNVQLPCCTYVTSSDGKIFVTNNKSDTVT